MVNRSKLGHSDHWPKQSRKYSKHFKDSRMRAVQPILPQLLEGAPLHEDGTSTGLISVVDSNHSILSPVPLQRVTKRSSAPAQELILPHKSISVARWQEITLMPYVDSDLTATPPN